MTFIKRWFQDVRSRRHGRDEPQHQQNIKPNEKGRAPGDDGDQSSVAPFYESQIDPLVAAQLHNLEKCHLTRLPEELLLCILHQIGNDVVALRCLRRVSQIFRRLSYDNAVWGRVKAPDWCRDSDFITETTSRLTNDEQMLLKRRLQTDGMCKDCKLWCDVHVPGWVAWAMQAINLDIIRQMPWRHECKFHSAGPRLNCHGCGTRQNIQNFAKSEWARYNMNRRCLGRQGAVQLCEHVHIMWQDIEKHFDEWEMRKPGTWEPQDWQACLEGFVIECNDPIHDRRCVADGSPTWPRASLRAGTTKRNAVLLSLEWSSHSGIDMPTRNETGRYHAEDLRALFRRNRQGAAEILFPSHHANPLPEMACFRSGECDCVYYETGKDEPIDDGKESRDGLVAWFRAHYPSLVDSGHVHSTFRGNPDLWIEDVRVNRHQPTRGDASCLVTTYGRQFFLFNRRDRGTKRMNPGHAWFHAMDPETYPRPDTLDLPFCNRKDCMNYFRRSKVSRCGSLALRFHH